MPIIEKKQSKKKKLFKGSDIKMAMDAHVVRATCAA